MNVKSFVVLKSLFIIIIIIIIIIYSFSSLKTAQ